MKTALMSRIDAPCCCSRSTTPRPASNRNFWLPASTNVLMPKRLMFTIGVPVPSSVTLISCATAPPVGNAHATRAIAAMVTNLGLGMLHLPMRFARPHSWDRPSALAGVSTRKNNQSRSKQQRHPEERGEAARLEGWHAGSSLPSFEPPAFGLLRLSFTRRQFLQPRRQLIELPFTRERGGVGPGRLPRGDPRQRCFAVHGGDRAVEPQLLRVVGITAGGEQLVEASVFAQQGGGAGRAHARRARQLVGGVAAQRDAIRHLARLDAVALAPL